MSLLSENDLFIFDWDGTLSTSTLLVAVSRLFQRRYDPKYIRRHEARYRKEVRDYEINETRGRELAWIYDAYVAVFPPRLKPGALELLAYLRKSHKKVVLFSDSKSYRLVSELRLLKVTDYFDFVLSASSVDRYKPDPTGLLVIRDKYKAERGRCIYFGDTASDALTAKFAGIKSCLVADGLESYVKVKSAEPDYLYKSLGTLVEAVKKGGKR